MGGGPLLLLVSFWRSDQYGNVVPGDAVVAADGWPRDEDDVAKLREAVRRIVQPGLRPAERVTLVNIVAVVVALKGRKSIL